MGPVRRGEIDTLFGSPGATVLHGGRHAPTLSVPIWVYNDYTQSQLNNFLVSLENKTGQVGTLTESGGVSATYPNCYLELVHWREPRFPPNWPPVGWSQKITLELRQMAP